MQEYIVKNFEELHAILTKYRKSNLWLFRGHKNGRWRLIPKAGRLPYSESNDIRSFNSWKRRALEFVKIEPTSDFDWLSIAQHHGLATRLLDWTFNPLVAAFFATQNNEDLDSFIYAYHYKRSIESDTTSPFDHSGVNVVRPNGITQRIVSQGGIFTLHNPPTLGLEEVIQPDETLEKIIIDSSYSQELQFELNHYGINHFTIFPDLDGLSRYGNWYMENRPYWLGRTEIDSRE